MRLASKLQVAAGKGGGGELESVAGREEPLGNEEPATEDGSAGSDFACNDAHPFKRLLLGQGGPYIIPLLKRGLTQPSGEG